MLRLLKNESSDDNFGFIKAIALKHYGWKVWYKITPLDSTNNHMYIYQKIIDSDEQYPPVMYMFWYVQIYFYDTWYTYMNRRRTKRFAIPMIKLIIVEELNVNHEGQAT